MKCALLAVGNEILLGDVLNSNAHNLSKNLSRAGYQVILHLAVQDQLSDILDALDFAAARAELVFVTGGLGPTSDDFTRKVIARWTETELKLDPTSWASIKKLFAERNYPLHDFQKQQCYFPEGAKILSNSRGTAPGFQMKKGACELVILPGPPREIQAIWEDHLAADFGTRIPRDNKASTRSWFCLGSGESQVAAVVEPLLEKSSLVYGYRTCFPYIEVRIEGSRAQLEQESALCLSLQRTMEQLGPVYTSASPHIELAAWICRKRLQLNIQDHCRHRNLEKRFAGLCTSATGLARPRPLSLRLQSRPAGLFMAGIDYRGQKRFHQLPKPGRKLNSQQAELLALEYALWFWLRELTGLGHQLSSEVQI